ncbi:MAG: hypothetical protein BGP09_03610 [Rhizobium sp. 60-20]|nr:MAG: hypothetical protein BGP09_03610 [Rhizobium sp. 60-20]
MRKGKTIEQFQESRIAAFRPELRRSKQTEPFRDSKESGKALERFRAARKSEMLRYIRRGSAA